MVDMSPEAVTARLEEACARHAESMGEPSPQAVSMSPEAITMRLREWAELTRMCLMLRKDVALID